MKSVVLSFAVLLIFMLPGYSQGQTMHSVSGSIVDKTSGQPLPGANVLITSPSFNAGVAAEPDGFFEIPDVPIGRYLIQVSFTGYDSYTDELLVIGGRFNPLKILLTESAVVLSEVTFNASRNDEHSAALHTISIEKALRIPANFFDPVRMATSYPSVVAANDQANSIIVKGNSPNSLSWRLNGIEIVNPNHLANAGTLSDKPVANGGGVNILSAQMLDKTNFYTGAFPTQFGNSVAGIFDMKLREGNKRQDLYTAQASVLGIDLSAEGPFTKRNNSSYLVNYRYSTVGLLSKMGVKFGDEDINFQDVSVNLTYDAKKGGSLSFFGFYGNSANTFKAKDEDERKEDKDKYNIDYTSYNYAVGLNYDKSIGQSGSLLIAAGYSSYSQERTSSLDRVNDFTEYQLMDDLFKHEKNLFSSHIRFSTKLKRASLTLGLMTNYQHDLIQSFVRFGFDQPNPFYLSRSLKGEPEGLLLQPYASLISRLSQWWSVEAGIRYVQFNYNNSTSVEPRLSIERKISDASSLNLAYRLTSQMQQPLTYIRDENRELGFTRSHHLELLFNHRIQQTLYLTSELFYQSLFDVPISRDPTSTFSVLNLYDEVPEEELVSRGTGKNYGLNITLEKSFLKNYYLLVGGSLYESKYTAADRIERDTRFNGKYTFTSTFGKEWKKESANRTISINSRLMYLGGMRESSIDVPLSLFRKSTAYDLSDPFSNRLEDYFRMDIRVSLRKDRPGYTRTLALDIQNVFNVKNEGYHYYDFTKGQIVTKFQLGIIPVLVYRIDF
jgi:hypothetical protein